MQDKHKEKVAKKIKAWLKKNRKITATSVRHIHAMAYVVGYAAPSCLVVARCWVESEKHLREFDKKSPLENVHVFDDSLNAGDWCSVAYYTTVTSGQTVAIPIVV